MLMARKKSVKRKSSQKPKKTQKWHAVPLKGSFMVISMLGFLITGYMVTNTNYKVSFMLVFTAMFVASLISMSKAPIKIPTYK